ncbi:MULTISPECIES: hypothetical protein [unclassified Pseudomonas]|uniref:hypothetical protein n=1 Tax=unclassified Pseudomonas TaxID=196821 RepID=UPI000B859E0C|nr:MULTISPECIES: hypothetical protein [unclassified Pseudomonas]
MKVSIESIFTGEGEIRVRFNCALGTAEALWVGAPPQCGESYDVEFDVDETLEWGVKITSTSNTVPLFERIGNCVKIVAKLVSIEANNTAVIDIGGAIILIEVSNLESATLGFVAIETINLTLFPINI